MNTRIDYLYRDASNYKAYNSVVLSGKMSAEDAERISKCLCDGTYFIPRDVGLPEIRVCGYRTDDDHCWFEWEIGVDKYTGEAFGFELTEDKPTVGIRVSELVKNFESVKKWNETSWMEDYEYKSYDQFCE